MADPEASAGEEVREGPAYAAVEAPIVRVVLLEDRAAVTRRVTVPEAGRHRLLLGPVSPLVDEQRLTFPSRAEGVVVEEARVVCRPIEAPAADPEAVQAQVEALREAREARERAADRVRRAREAHLRARQATTSATEATTRALQTQDDPVAWAEAVQVIARREAAALEAVAEAEIALGRRTEEETAAARELDGLRGTPDVRGDLDTSEIIDGGGDTTAPSGRVHGWIELTLVASGAAEQLVRYVVPCAAWRPSHRVRHTTGERGERVHWEQWAACWNATGEDWLGVKVVCSTSREGERARPPAIQDDVIRVQHEVPPDLPDDPSDEILVGDAPVIHQAADLPGIDDGGSPLRFEVEGPMDLPSDGRVTEAHLRSWSGAAESGWWAVPEHSPLVVRRSEQVNGSGGPLLAGPVELVRDGVYVGRGAIPLVADGEAFWLEWGNHPQLRMDRRRTHQIERQKATGTLTHEFRVEVDVRHVGPEPVVLKVRERVPISEYADVFVTGPETAPELTPPTDDDGFCTWEVEIPPHTMRELSLFYTIRAAADAELPFQGP